MPGQAFDGSIWVAGGQIASLVFGTAGLTAVGAVLLGRAAAQRPDLQEPTYLTRGRRKLPLRMDAPLRGQQQEPEMISAERLEEVLMEDQDRTPEQVLREVSAEPKK